MKSRIIILSLIAVGIIVIVAYIWRGKVVAPVPTVNNFTDCVQAGFPVAESFPRQCRTSEGKVFVEEVASSTQQLGGCRDSSSCKNGEFCNQGICQSADFTYSCQSANDCLLVNRDLAYGCCYAGACQPIDYSQDQWIAVNRGDFEAKQKTYCPAQSQCGPAPACAQQFVQTDFVAGCVSNRCIKTEGVTPVPKKNPPATPTVTCKDSCGDGRCQSATDCFGANCSCPETIASCPRDCDPKNWPD